MNILCIGAHPDDVEGAMGATAALYSRRGHHVIVASVTDGRRGHFAPQYLADPSALARRRRDEALHSAALIGAEYRCLDIPDGEVYVTPANTEAVIRLIRAAGPPGVGPDVVFLNRPNDYHRDHRYTARLVLDATYMLTVPGMCPDAPHLARMPVFAYWYDDFTEGGTFRADVVVPIGDALEAKVDMICAHASQFFEWLPYNAGILDQVPPDAAGRREWIRRRYEQHAYDLRNKLEAALIRLCGLVPRQGVEAFQVCEYGRQPQEQELYDLFPIPKPTPEARC
ncbi:MAG: PIG-L deacetylase family protein [Chthonomonadales bacterium]